MCKQGCRPAKRHSSSQAHNDGVPPAREPVGALKLTMFAVVEPQEVAREVHDDQRPDQRYMRRGGVRRSYHTDTLHTTVPDKMT